MHKKSRIFITGHRGMVGSAILENLEENGYTNILTATRDELDLRGQDDVNQFMEAEKPDYVIVAAAQVGGIQVNSEYPWQFLYDNLMIEANLIQASHKNEVQDLIFLGSSCIYPKMAPQPIREDSLLTGPLEPTNQWYAIAKITGVKLCQALNQQYGRNYISLMPTNLFGPRDNFSLNTSHVLPAMIRKFQDAAENQHRTVKLWGSGSPRREFLHVTDLAEAVRFVMEKEDLGGNDLINVGTGVEITIKDLAGIVQRVIGHRGSIEWDLDKPDGTPRKLMDVSLINSLGWKAEIDLEDGIEETYRWFLSNRENIREMEIHSDYE